MKKLLVVSSLVFSTSLALAGTFYAAPLAKVDSENPNYCLLPECAGTLKDAVALANQDGIDTEVVLLEGAYNADWDPCGLTITIEDCVIRADDGLDRSQVVIDGGGDTGARRAFWFTCESFDADYTVRGITFRNFHLTHARDVNVVRKGAVLAIVEKANLTVEDCDFNDNTCGILGEAAGWDMVPFSHHWRSLTENAPKFVEAGPWGTSWGSGGAIYAFDQICPEDNDPKNRGNMCLRNCNFTRNKSCGTGSAICSYKNTTADGCTFVDNECQNGVADVSYYTGTFCCEPIAREACGGHSAGAGICYCIYRNCWASNCVFRGNHNFSANEIRGGAVHNMNTYRCKFYDNGCHGQAAGWGGTVWGYNDPDKYTHIEDVVDNSDRPPEWSMHQSEFRGGKYYRCRFGGSNRTEAASATLSGNHSSFYNCLFQDFYYYNYKPSRLINCTFARCRWGGHSWNGFFMEMGEMVNSAMLECESMNGCIVEFHSGGTFVYTPGALTMQRSVYYAADKTRIHPDWGSKGDNTWYQPSPVPGQEGKQYYSYINPSSTTDPFRPARDCYLVDRGMKLDGMDDKHSLMSRDLLGNPRCVGGAPDIGCYEYYIKPGISVMLR